jgi:hypothetical protein
LLSIVENEDPFPFPTISICAEPYQNFTRIQELGLSKDIWTFYKYNSEKNFEGWPMNKSSNGTDIWESTTFGLWQMIEEVNMKYVNESYVFNQSNFKLEDENSWLYLKVINLNWYRFKDQGITLFIYITSSNPAFRNAKGKICPVFKINLRNLRNLSLILDYQHSIQRPMHFNETQKRHFSKDQLPNCNKL